MLRVQGQEKIGEREKTHVRVQSSNSPPTAQQASVSTVQHDDGSSETHRTPCFPGLRPYESAPENLYWLRSEYLSLMAGADRPKKDAWQVCPGDTQAVTRTPDADTAHGFCELCRSRAGWTVGKPPPRQQSAEQENGENVT